MKQIGFYLVFFAFLLSACSSPSINDKLIQTAIAQTMTAQATDTLTPIPNTPTSSNTPTATFTLFPTATITPSPTSTPDNRIIIDDPQKYLLKKIDLPADGFYFLPNQNWIGRQSNELTVSNWTVEKGREYLARTGRVDGWWVYYARGTRTVYLPEQVYCDVVFFRTVEGAQIALTDYNRSKIWPEEGFSMVDKIINLGDMNNIEMSSKVTSGGDKRITYEINFTYHNVFVSIAGLGLEKDVTHEFVENMARAVLAKLKIATLSMPPTSTPNPYVDTPIP